MRPCTLKLHISKFLLTLKIQTRFCSHKPIEARGSSPFVLSQTINSKETKIKIPSNNHESKKIDVQTIYHHVSKPSLSSTTRDYSLNKKNTKLFFWDSFSRVKNSLESIFLPYGYPQSVASGYGRYVLWQGLYYVSSTAQGVLSSTFLLYSVGLGAGAIPTAGAINWILKDGLGQLGTLLMAKMVSHRFDMHTKTWYLLGSIKYVVAVFMELATLAYPQHFLTLGSAANSIKGLSWMCTGSTRSAFNVCFAKSGNIGDITAKATSQTILYSSVGNFLGVSLCYSIGQSTHLALSALSSLAFIYLYSGYKSAQCVPLNSLNPTRLSLLINEFHNNDIPNNLSSSSSSSSSLPGSPLFKLSTAEELALKDPVIHFLPLKGSLQEIPIQCGLDLHHLIDKSDPDDLNEIFQIFQQEKYMVFPLGPKHRLLNNSERQQDTDGKDRQNPRIHGQSIVNGDNRYPTIDKIAILLHNNCSSKDILQAHLQAHLIQQQQLPQQQQQQGQKPEVSKNMFEALKETKKLSKQQLSHFQKALLEHDWDPDYTMVENKPQRAIW